MIEYKNIDLVNVHLADDRVVNGVRKRRSCNDEEDSKRH